MQSHNIYGRGTSGWGVLSNVLNVFVRLTALIRYVLMKKAYPRLKHLLSITLHPILQQNSNVESRPFSAPNRQRLPMSAPKSVPTAALMEAASQRGPNAYGLQSWINGIFRSQGIPKQVLKAAELL